MEITVQLISNSADISETLLQRSVRGVGPSLISQRTAFCFELQLVWFYVKFKGRAQELKFLLSLPVKVDSEVCMLFQVCFLITCTVSSGGQRNRQREALGTF